MLTSDLVRLRIHNKVVRPGWVAIDDEAKRASAAQILTLVAEHEGQTRGELDEALNAAIGTGRDFKILRGFARLVLRKTEITTQAVLKPAEVREAVFAAAAADHPLSPEQRARVMAEVAQRFEVEPDEVEEALFADLNSNQRVGPCPQWTAEELVHRYNLALAQAVLLKTHSLRIELEDPDPKRLRQMMRFLKFHRLMFEAQPTSGGWKFVVDGPTTIVSNASRYGMSLARFLPALLLAERWTLEADYQRKKGTRHATFSLSPKQGLVSSLRDTGTWTADEERALIARLRELSEGWEVDESGAVVDLDGRGHLVPDVVLREPKTGAEAYVEVVWRWRKKALERRWSLLGKAGPPNLVLCVCTQPADQRDVELPGAVHTFKGVPNARSVWRLAREVARRPPKARRKKKS